MDELFLALRVVVSLAAVLGAIWWIQKKVAKKRGLDLKKKADIQVVSRTAVGAKASIVVADVEGRRLLLGVTEQQVSILESFDQQQANEVSGRELAAAIERTPTMSAFDAVFESAHASSLATPVLPDVSPAALAQVAPAAPVAAAPVVTPVTPTVGIARVIPEPAVATPAASGPRTAPMPVVALRPERTERVETFTELLTAIPTPAKPKRVPAPAERVTAAEFIARMTPQAPARPQPQGLDVFAALANADAFDGDDEQATVTPLRRGHGRRAARAELAAAEEQAKGPLHGSLLSPSTWRQTANALRQAR